MRPVRPILWMTLFGLVWIGAVRSADEADKIASPSMRRAIENLGSRVAAIRARAAKTIVEIGESALPELERSLRADPVRREAIAEIVDQIRWGVDLVPVTETVETPAVDLFDLTVLGELGFGPDAARNPKLVETLVRRMREEGESFARPTGVDPPPLTHALHALDGMRRGRDTPFADVVRRGEELLAAYPEPADRGRIAAMVAHVHGQSGVPPETAAWALRALKLPLEPGLRLRMYEYVYSATLLHQVGPADRSKSEGRRALLRPAIYGLCEALRYDLPSVAHELPNIVLPADDSPESRRIHRRQVQARRVAEFAREMVKNRDILIDRVVKHATQSPEERDEFRRLLDKEVVVKALTRTLRDPAVDPADGLRIAREAAEGSKE